MKLTANQARDLAQVFREISVALGEYRFANWDSLTKTQRDIIEDTEWTLLNYSSDFVTHAVGLTLDDATASLKNIQEATKKAKQAVETITTIKKIVVIAGAVVKLGAAIATENPSAIASATEDLFSKVAA